MGLAYFNDATVGSCHVSKKPGRSDVLSIDKMSFRQMALGQSHWVPNLIKKVIVIFNLNERLGSMKMWLSIIKMRSQFGD